MHMKRIVLLAGALAVALAGLVGIGPAHADFHGSCGFKPDGVTHDAVASVDLSVSSSGQFVFSGMVHCLNATSISIDSLELSQVPIGATYAAQPASCSSCSDVSTSGTAPTSAGEWKVVMHFTSTGNGLVFHPVREGRWIYSGSGTSLTKVCPLINGQSAVNNGCLP